MKDFLGSCLLGFLFAAMFVYGIPAKAQTIQLTDSRGYSQGTVQINGNTNTAFGANTVVGTPMTLDANYYSSWQTTTANNLAAGQMASVIENFQKLGYTVSRASSDAQHIYWNISW